MPKKVTYEWIALEFKEEEGERYINNIDGHDNFVDAMEMSIDMNDDEFVDNGVELVKYYMEGSIEGQEWRESNTTAAWDIDTQSFGTEFDDGSKIPKYLLKEVEKEVKTWGGDE